MKKKTFVIIDKQCYVYIHLIGKQDYSELCASLLTDTVFVFIFVAELVACILNYRTCANSNEG